jgi:phosphoribosylamine---glycine ligase
MRILVVGGGGREHALCWKIAQSPLCEVLFAAPGNAGIGEIAENRPIQASDHDGVLKLCRNDKIDLCVVGPEDPLVAGLADKLRAAGVRVFGPGKEAAQIEGSKTFAKTLMRRYAVPTASFRSFDQFDEAAAYLESQQHFPVVIKADGLAAGKGVVLPQDLDQAIAAARSMLEEKKFGEAGRRIVIEEFLRGEELSALCLTDGRTILVLEPAQDFKRVFDGDQGPNTGGMGAFSPVPLATESLMATVTRDILVRVVHAFTRDRLEYRGVLYAGLMATRGGPKVVEFNCRFGDPETQVVLARLRSDLVPLLVATADGKLADVQDLEWDPRAAVCVVMASRGYPESSSKGDAIEGLEAAGAMDDVVVFHGATARAGDRVLTSGGRVLGVTALGDTVEAARAKAYAAVAKISFPGMQFRTDIAVARPRSDHRG